MSASAIEILINSIILGYTLWWFTYRKWWPYNWKGTLKEDKKKDDKQQKQ